MPGHAEHPASLNRVVPMRALAFARFLFLLSYVSRRQYANEHRLFSLSSVVQAEHRLIALARSFFLPLIWQSTGRSTFHLSDFVSKSNNCMHGKQMKLAVLAILRFSSRMIRRHKTGSKLCASMTRHATGRRPRAVADGSTCKGAYPRCIPQHLTPGSHGYA